MVIQRRPAIRSRPPRFASSGARLPIRGPHGTTRSRGGRHPPRHARPLRPRLVVLVFVPNGYVDDFPLRKSWHSGMDPGRPWHVSAARAENGRFRLRPPDPDFRRFRLTGPRSETSSSRRFARPGSTRGCEPEPAIPASLPLPRRMTRVRERRSRCGGLPGTPRPAVAFRPGRSHSRFPGVEWRFPNPFRADFAFEERRGGQDWGSRGFVYG